jgi:hypothetical protein
MSRRAAVLLAGLWIGGALLAVLAVWLMGRMPPGVEGHYYVDGTRFEILSVPSDEEKSTYLGFAVGLLLVFTVPAGLAFWKIGGQWSWLFLSVGSVSLIAAVYFAVVSNVDFEIEYSRMTNCPSFDAFVQGLCPAATATPAGGTGDSTSDVARCQVFLNGRWVEESCPTQTPGATLPPGTNLESEGHCFLIVRGAGLEMPCPTPMPSPASILDDAVEGRCYRFVIGKYEEFPCGTATPFPLP